MSVESNPLKQYFRRPAIQFRLPSQGKEYAVGVVDIPPTGELPVYPMTAIDEITVKTPDALFNGSAIVELIKSCIPAIHDPWAINSIDFDAILIAIKAASGGNQINIDSQCPNCETLNGYDINLLQLLTKIKAPDYSSQMKIGELQIKFKPLDYKQMNEASLAQFDVQRTFLDIEKEPNDDKKNKKGQEALKRVTELTMKILSEAIEYVDTPTSRVINKNHILDFLHNCDKNMYISIRDYNADLKAKSELPELNIDCPECKHRYNQPFTLNAADFFG